MAVINPKSGPATNGTAADQIVVTCDAKTCQGQVAAPAGSTYDQALEIAEAAGWNISDYASGAWTYCPTHAGEFAGHTPSGRRLISGF